MPAIAQHVNLYLKTNEVPKLTDFVSDTLLDRYDKPECKVTFALRKTDPHLTQRVEEDNLHAEIDCLQYEIDRLEWRLRALQKGVIAYAFRMDEIIFERRAEEPVPDAPERPTPELAKEAPWDKSSGIPPLPDQNPVSTDRPGWAR